jgi:hypothetical protein
MAASGLSQAPRAPLFLRDGSDPTGALLIDNDGRWLKHAQTRAAFLDNFIVVGLS